MNKVWQASITVTGTGETKDEAVDALLFDMNEISNNIQFKSGGEDCIKFEQVEE